MDGGGVPALHAIVAATADDGCAFILDEDSAIRRLKLPTSCGAARRPGSPYCAPHHAVCHIAGGSAGEWRRLREIEALAAAVGGRCGRAERLPPDRFLRRLEQIARGFLRPDGSRIVLERHS
jgi:hypothetical protein